MNLRTGGVKFPDGTTQTTAASGGSGTYIVLHHEESSGTAGGSIASGSWVSDSLNTEVLDPNNDVSIAANQFTLTAGTYKYKIQAMTCETNLHRARLVNVTDGNSVVSTSMTYRNTGSSNVCNAADLSGEVTIASSKTFRVEHRVSSTHNTTGLGQAAGFGVDEIYMRIELWKQ